MVRIIWLILTVGTGLYTIYLMADIYRHRREQDLRKNAVKLSLIGLICMFGDTIGIGSFATYSSSWKMTKCVDDEKMPGTLNAGTAICTAVEGVFFLGDSEVDPVTCITMIVAAMLGALIGSKIVCRMNAQMIRYGMSAALSVLAIVLIFKNAGIGPFGTVGTAYGVRGIKLFIAITVNFILGALMMIGVGLYAPCMALVSLLGMNVNVAFPVMMGSCGALMLTGGLNFIKEGKYDRPAALYSTLAGIVGVYLAFRFVKSLSISMLMWVVIAAMFVTAGMFFKDARKRSKTEARESRRSDENYPVYSTHKALAE